MVEAAAILEPLPYTAVLGVERPDLRLHAYSFRTVCINLAAAACSEKRAALSGHALCMYVCIRRWCKRSLYDMFDLETFRADALR